MIQDQTRKQAACFLVGVTVITWGCVWGMGRLAQPEGFAQMAAFTALDFLESASPLLMAVVLLRKPLFRERRLAAFFLGAPTRPVNWLLAGSLFLLQYLNFAWFRTRALNPAFPGLLLAQCLLGGGLEEAGWRGYLLPVLRRRFSVLPASVLVSLIWVGWHLPYFIQPGAVRQGYSFPAYLLIGVLTGFCLTAIYGLTRSVLLCTAFHSFQNALVMALDADTASPLFQACFLALGVFAAVLCVAATRDGAQPRQG